jgi:nucleotide-binding universal stress UspA family protein
MSHPADIGELIYVSWGGTGRGAALRAAYDQAADADQSLTYLAILDPPHFADLDTGFITLVIDELEWLLNAHMKTVAEASYKQVASTRVIVRTGEVADEVVQLAKTSGAQSIVLGAPIAIGRTSVEDLVAALCTRTGVNVTIVDPDAPLPA